jgi:hypothetical protein
VACPLWVDAVEKVENRTMLKISQMVIFGLFRRSNVGVRDGGGKPSGRLAIANSLRIFIIPWFKARQPAGCELASPQVPYADQLSAVTSTTASAKA